MLNPREAFSKKVLAQIVLFKHIHRSVKEREDLYF